jgi:hypothetical protein
MSIEHIAIWTENLNRLIENWIESSYGGDGVLRHF